MIGLDTSLFWRLFVWIKILRATDSLCWRDIQDQNSKKAEGQDWSAAHWESYTDFACLSQAINISFSRSTLYWKNFKNYCAQSSHTNIFSKALKQKKKTQTQTQKIGQWNKNLSFLISPNFFVIETLNVIFHFWGRTSMGFSLRRGEKYLSNKKWALHYLISCLCQF